MFENVSDAALESVAVDRKDLATNIADVAQDCIGDLDIASEIQNRFPVVSRLLATRMSREMRNRASAGLINTHKATIGEATKWVLEIPRTIYTTEPTSTANECCWVPFDFDKCGENVPLNLLCLKDCESIEDSIMNNIVRFGARDAVPGIASAGDRLGDVKLRVDRLSMAFFTAKNILLGIDNTYTATLKPFHGVLSVLENPAVSHINGTNILEAFDLLGCRLAVVGGSQWFAVHPMIYAAIDAAVYPDERGNLPAGWSKANGLSFMGRIRQCLLIQRQAQVKFGCSMMRHLEYSWRQTLCLQKHLSEEAILLAMHLLRVHAELIASTCITWVRHLHRTQTNLQ